MLQLSTHCPALAPLVQDGLKSENSFVQQNQTAKNSFYHLGDGRTGELKWIKMIASVYFGVAKNRTNVKVGFPALSPGSAIYGHA